MLFIKMFRLCMCNLDILALKKPYCGEKNMKVKLLMNP